MKTDKDKCFTECIPENTNIIHPLYLTEITSNKPFCLVYSSNFMKNCDNPENNLIENNIFTPSLGISEIIFLNSFYNIHSWNDLLNYQKKYIKENKTTISRLLKYAWVAFFDSIKNDIDNIIDCYQFFKNKFLSKSNIDIREIIIYIKKNLNEFSPNEIGLYINSKILENK